MKVLLYVVIGLALVMVQGSKLLPTLGLNPPPDFVLVYLMFIGAYSDISVEILVFIGFLSGMAVDVMSGSLLLASFVYPAVTVVFLMFRDKFLQLSFIVKLVLFLVVNASYVFLNHVGIYVYSGQFPRLFEQDWLTFVNNLVLFYMAYLVRIYLNEKTTQEV